MRATRLCLVLLLGLGAAVTHAQIVQGQVVGIGFQTSKGPVIREGQWFPILVTLQCQGSQVFSGELRVETADLDGDRVAYTQPQVTLAGEGGPPKRFWCYAVAEALNELPTAVDLVSDQDALVAELPLPAQPVATLVSEDLLILDLSYPHVTRLDGLESSTWSPGERTEGRREFYRNVVVAHLPAADLPDRWWGLEAVDVVIWDKPDPVVLSIAQRDALRAWVRAGGQLIIGVGPQWGALRKSDLADILPLAGEGATVEVTRLPALFDNVAPSTWRTREFRTPVAVTTAQPAAGAFRTLGDFGPTGALALVTMRLVGSGRVVTLAGGLADMLDQAPLEVDKLVGALIDLNRYPTVFKDKEAETLHYGLDDRERLYDGFVKPVQFTATTALLGLFAFLFVAAYIVLATLASWAWLRGRKQTHLSWTVFAGCAVLASAASLGTVSAVQGLSRGVHSFCIVDLEAGSTEGRGPCLFGYCSPVRQRVDLALAGDAGWLRPLARNPRGATRYVTPARYANLPTRGLVQDMLVRATLKQVAGHWAGTLNGTLRGDLRVDRATGRLTAGSWLANDLTVGLDGGYLLFIDPRQDAAGVPWRAAGLNTLYPLVDGDAVKADVAEVPPAANVLVVRVPAIAAGQQVSELGKAEYGTGATNRERWEQKGTRARSELLGDKRDLPTLWGEQQNWLSGGLSGLLRLRGETTAALQAVLLGSTRNYHLHNRGIDLGGVGRPLSLEAMPPLDITHWLLRGQAVLICWSSTPGPARLMRNGRLLDASEGLTVYRVRLPLAYEGVPPRPEAGLGVEGVP